jgi:hypothetical protein
MKWYSQKEKNDFIKIWQETMQRFSVMQPTLLQWLKFLPKKAKFMAIVQGLFSMFFNQIFHGALIKLWKYAYTPGTLQ